MRIVQNTVLIADKDWIGSKHMKAKRLKEIMNDIDDELEVFVRNSVNICGNIGELEQIEVSEYGFFGTLLPCIILNTDSSKHIETNDEDELIDFIKINGVAKC